MMKNQTALTPVAQKSSSLGRNGHQVGVNRTVAQVHASVLSPAPCPRTKFQLLFHVARSNVSTSLRELPVGASCASFIAWRPPHHFDSTNDVGEILRKVRKSVRTRKSILRCESARVSPGTKDCACRGRTITRGEWRAC